MRPCRVRSWLGLLVTLPFWGAIGVAVPQQSAPPQIEPGIRDLARKTVENIAKLHPSGVLLVQLDSCFGQQKLCDQLDAALYNEVIARISSAQLVSRDEATKYLVKHGFLAIDGYLGALDDVAADAGADIVISQSVSSTGNRCKLETKISETKPLKARSRFKQDMDCLSAPSGRYILLKDLNTGAAIPISNSQGPLFLKEGNYPKCIACPPPKYSPDLQKKRAEGVVRVLVTVNPGGELEDPRVLGATDAEMVRVSLQTMIGWRLSPATDQDGNPFPERTLVEVNFKLF